MLEPRERIAESLLADFFPCVLQMLIQAGRLHDLGRETWSCWSISSKESRARFSSSMIWC